MNSHEFSQRLIALSRDLRQASADLESQARGYALAERLYRMERARAYLQAKGKTVGEREANVDLAPITGDERISPNERRSEPDTVSDLRYRRDLAEGLKVAALERVRSARQEVSALQSLASLAKEEAAFDRVGPGAA
jgi:hypothetical protein